MNIRCDDEGEVDRFGIGMMDGDQYISRGESLCLETVN